MSQQARNNPDQAPMHEALAGAKFDRRKLSMPDFHAGLRKHFPGIGNAGRFLCRTSLMMGSPRLDIITFDDWLHEKHGESENAGQSMRECIAANYSPEAASFVESLI